MSIWQQRKELIRNRSFTLFLLHAFITVAAGAMCYIVLTWHAITYHNHHALMASILISISFWLPSTVLSPLAGVIVDRYPRKRILMITNLLRMLSFAFIGLWLLHDDSLWICCALNFINGIIFTVLGPTVMAFVREIAPNHKLLAANSTIDICVELANILGMGIASVLITLTAITTSLLIIASGIGLGAMILLFIKQNPATQYHNREKSTPWREFKDGLAYLIERPILALLYGLNAVLFIQFMVSPILLAPFIKTVIHGNGHDFSFAELCLCLGIVAGSFLLPWICEKIGRIRCLLGAIIWLSTIFFLISISHNINQVALLYTLLGIGLPLWSIIASYSQEHTAKSMQGRTQATFNIISSLCLMLVYLTLSINSSPQSIAHSYWFCTGLGLVALVFLYGVYRGLAVLNSSSDPQPSL